LVLAFGVPCWLPLSALAFAADPPPQAVAAFEAGQEAFGREDFKGAELHFQSAIALDAAYVDPRCALGQVYMVTRRYTAAVAALTKCKSLIQAAAAEQVAAGATREAEADREIQELKESIRRIRSGEIKSANEQTILRLEERLRTVEESRSRRFGRGPVVPAELSFALGTAHLRNGSLQAAERELLEALGARADFGEAHNNLAAVYAGSARWEEAQKHVDLAEAGGFPVSPGLKSDITARREGVVRSDRSIAAGPIVPAEDQRLTIEHAPVECVPSGRFPRIDAQVSPAETVVSAKVRFRTEKSGWYAIELHPEEGTYSATLPRPRSTHSFHYYVEAVGDTTESVRTQEYVTTVVKDREACGTKRTEFATSASGLLVEPPPGRNQPRVPAGFSSRGVVGDVGQFELSAPVAVGAAAIVGGVVAAAALANAGTEFEGIPGVGEPFVTGPGIAFVGSTPPPGSALSFSGGTLNLQLQVFSPTDVPGAMVMASLYTPNSLAPCIVLESRQDLLAGRSELATPAGPVTRQPGGCGGPLHSISQLRVAVSNSALVTLFETGQAGIPHIQVSYDLVP
jgi:Flp pilus assembly protein TadD